MVFFTIYYFKINNENVLDAEIIKRYKNVPKIVSLIFTKIGFGNFESLLQSLQKSARYTVSCTFTILNSF